MNNTNIEQLQEAYKFFANSKHNDHIYNAIVAIRERNKHKIYKQTIK
jgi:hypothetical protein